MNEINERFRSIISYINAGVMDDAREFVGLCRNRCYAYAGINGYRFNERFGEMDWEKEEFFHEVMVRVWEHLADYNDEYPFTSWYETICHNTYIKHAVERKKKTDKITSFDDIHDGDERDLYETVPSDIDIEGDFIRNNSYAWSLLRAAYEALNPNYRYAMKYHYIEGYSVRDTAAVLGVSESTVNNWLSRGRKKLYEFCMEQDLKEDLYEDLEP